MKNFLYIFLFMLLGSSLQNSNSFAQTIPLQGEILITEFMANPSSVSDTKGEWVELFNMSDKSLLLNGITISDLGSNTHTLASEEDIVLAPGSFFILARNANPDENGGITPDYIYSNFTLGNSEDEIVLTSSEDSLLDRVLYNSEWVLYSGASLELNNEIADIASNDLAINWHPAIETYGSGDLGTPGQANSISSGIYRDSQITYFEAFPNPCKDELSIRLSANSKSPINIELINILGQSIPILTSDKNKDLNFSIDLSPFPVGIYWLGISLEDQRECLKIIKN